jgi:hypothetical protein
MDTLVADRPERSLGLTLERSELSVKAVFETYVVVDDRADLPNRVPYSLFDGE